MIIFRPRRMTLEESMAEAAIFEDIDLMIDHIVKINTYSGLGPMVSKDDISIDKKTAFEKSTGWKDCRKVLASRFGGEDYSPPEFIGYCAFDFSQG